MTIGNFPTSRATWIGSLACSRFPGRKRERKRERDREKRERRWRRHAFSRRSEARCPWGVLGSSRSRKIRFAGRGLAMTSRRPSSAEKSFGNGSRREWKPEWAFRRKRWMWIPVSPFVGWKSLKDGIAAFPAVVAFQVFGDSIFFFLVKKKRILEIYNESCYPYSPFSSEDRENIQEICSVIRVRILPTLLPFEGISRARNNVS